MTANKSEIKPEETDTTPAAPTSVEHTAPESTMPPAASNTNRSRSSRRE